MSQTTNVNTAPEEQHQAEYLTKYGFMRCNYLQDHRPDLYREYLQSGELKSHCLEVQAVSHNPPPSRNTDGLAWAAHMNMLKHSIEEVIYAELIYE